MLPASVRTPAAAGRRASSRRGRDTADPFYDLIATIAFEENSHIALVASTIDLLLTGASERGAEPTTAPLAAGKDARNTHHVIASRQSALPAATRSSPKPPSASSASERMIEQLSAFS